MAGRVVRENGLLIADYDEEVGYRIWNKLHQRDVDVVHTEEEMQGYFDRCAPNILPEEPFGALWNEIERCYPIWFRAFSGQITSMCAPNVFGYHVVQMAVVGKETIRFFTGGEEIFKIKMHLSHENLMSFVSARNVSLYSAKADTILGWSLDMEKELGVGHASRAK